MAGRRSIRLDFIVYNKGTPIELALRRPAMVVQRPEGGRESETYLFHIEVIERPAKGYTVLTQGNPFDHAPDFIGLLATTNRWRAIQPLTCKTDPKYDMPPNKVIEAHTSEFIDGAAIRSETFSVYTIAPVHFYAWTGRSPRLRIGPRTAPLWIGAASFSASKGAKPVLNRLRR